MKQYFKSAYNEFVYLRTYARWIESKGRRETWPETVDRYMDFMCENVKDSIEPHIYREIREAILNHEVMPSMRALQFAGEPMRRTHAAGYNCAYIAPETWLNFSEILYALMLGTGVGFSVSKDNVNKLPLIQPQTNEPPLTHIVGDSKEGWADSLLVGLEFWASGKDVLFNYSKVRPSGTRLKTFGGYASGPDPLKSLHDFTREIFLSRQGKRLTTLNVHDILTKIAEIVVCGGVRRSAMISLSDLEDSSLRDCKQGAFWDDNPQRALSNNSAIYKEKPSPGKFLKEFSALIESGSGERGIFNLSSILANLPARRRKLWEQRGVIKDSDIKGNIGTNPCAEIILNSYNGDFGNGGQMCNLSEVICRPQDTIEDLKRKTRLATIIGTYQSSLTKFGDYLGEQWRENCEAERLLGVSLTGQWDCPEVRKDETLLALRELAIEVNREYAQNLNIGRSTAITTVKPSGTVSQMVGCSSGLHASFSQYYIRRVRITVNDPLFQMARDQGVPALPEVGQDPKTATTWVLEFPQKAQEGAVLQKDLSALDQLEYWKKVKVNYTEHNPSVTIFVRENEWIKVADWVLDNWDIVGGISFLPATDHIYELAPYEEITKKEYEIREKLISGLDLSRLPEYEKTDKTQQKRELACAGGQCEL